jgi:ABC-type branched-subunit amino acid transport system substrate-binding protein
VSSKFHAFRWFWRGQTWPLILLLCICACVSQTQKQPGALSPPDAEDLVFQEAESLFQKERTEQALPQYSRYLGQYPQGRHAAAALQRIGSIYQRQGDLSAAQAFYRNAIDTFPQTPAANEARMGLIDVLIQGRRSAEAVDIALQMLSSDLAPPVRYDLWRRLAHVYQSAGDSANAALYSYRLFKSLPPPENEQWRTLLMQSVEHMDGPGVHGLWDQIDDPQIRAEMMYRYAMVQMAAGYDGDALGLLTAFRSAFPDHPKGSEADNLIRELTQRLSFAPHTLGCLLPLSGSHQAYGQRVLNAIELALSLMQGGESPVAIKLIVKDTASDDARAVQEVRALAQEKVGAIIGPIITAQAAAREAQRLNIPMVTFTQKPEITAIGDYIFRHFITPQNQVQTLVSFFVKDLGLRDFAVMYPDEPYGKTFMTLFWDEVVRQGGRMVGAEAYAPGQTDFAVTIKRLAGLHLPVPADLSARPVVQVERDPYYQRRSQASDNLEVVLPDPVTRVAGLFYQDPDQDRVKKAVMSRMAKGEEGGVEVHFDVLFIPDAPKTAGLILPQLVFHDIKNVFLAGTNLWHSKQLIDMTQAYAQNAIMVDGFYKDSSSPIVRNFVDTYRSIYNSDPGVMEAFAFDTANLLIDLLSHPDLRLRHELRDALRQVYQADGVTGSTAFAPNGEAIKQLSLLRIKGNQFVEIPHP